MERDLLIFVDHTDQHIVEELKKNQPAWITKDGYCPKCLEYYKRVSRDPKEAGSKEWETVNIGPRQVQKRAVLAAFGAGLGLLLLLSLKIADLPKGWRLFVFFPFFAGALGFFQAKKKLCVMYAQKNLRNMDSGEEAVADPSQGAAIRRDANRLWVFSALSAAALSLIGFLL